MLTVELHCHSELSHDGRDPVELLLQQAEAVGLDALAVTDHDQIEASRRAAKLASDYGLVGIPGIEITTRAGHVLGLGVDERVPAGLPFEETLDRIHAQGGVAVVPHPFQKSRSGVAANISRRELSEADAIEVYNSRLLTGRGNRRAHVFADAHGLPMTAGSDAHISEMVGQAVTKIDADGRNAGAILDAIEAGRTEIDGKRTPWRISFRQAAGGAKRRVLSRVTGFLG
ncbi:PHP domain-containing protein [halophilic archaeon]|nr:PHP domain-containing protein [halophilic archaeon]